METTENVEQEIKAIEERLAEAKQKLERLKTKKVEMWRPDQGGVYHSIGGDGTLSMLNYYTPNRNYYTRYNYGNIFKDIATAEYFRDRRAARNRLELLALEVECGIYKFIETEDNWCITRLLDCYVCLNWNTNQSSTVYFSSRENAIKVLNSLTDKEKELLWGAL